VRALGLGWAGRLLLAGVLLAAGAFEAGAFAWAALLAVAFVAEAVSSWRRDPGGAGGFVSIDDEEDE
jgi:hypothetical protein